MMSWSSNKTGQRLLGSALVWTITPAKKYLSISITTRCSPRDKAAQTSTRIKIPPTASTNFRSWVRKFLAYFTTGTNNKKITATITSKTRTVDGHRKADYGKQRVAYQEFHTLSQRGLGCPGIWRTSLQAAVLRAFLHN